MSEPHPEQLLTEDIKRLGGLLVRRVSDWARRYMTIALAKYLLVGAIGVGAAFYSLPLIAAVACTIAVLGSLIFAVYGHKIASSEYASRRWTWIAANRLQQDTLRVEQRLDAAVFDVLGQAPPNDTGTCMSSPELRQAVAVLRQRAFRREQPLTDRPRHEAQPPDLGVVASRMRARKAEIDALEADIQSLAVAEQADAAMAAEEARRHADSLREAARRADQEARERVRRGQTATHREPGAQLSVTVTPTGVRGVSVGTPSLTPEQIAQGRLPSDQADATAAGRTAT
jgi:hypothetical protein